ncbi:MAG: polysaccharide biosynthesis protein [Lactobacillales bacterium]|nr:polysaccharide biosynthesis protein [Lactobacillales bacterium]
MLTRKMKIAILFLVDSAVILFANFASYLFLKQWISVSYGTVFKTFMVSWVLYLVFAHFLKIFKRINRYTNLREMTAITVATTGVAILEFCILPFVIQSSVYSIRLVFLTYLITTFGVIASRLVWRLIIEYRIRFNLDKRIAKPTIVIGAGKSGQLLAETLKKSNENSGIQIVGFVDDDPDKVNTYLQGYNVLGTIAELPLLVDEYNVQMVTIAIPSLSEREYSRIMDILTPLNVVINSIPAIEDMANGRFSVSRLKEIDIVDLLGRAEVKLDHTTIAEQITGKTIMVTGAGGSIGGEICRQVLRFTPKELVLLGHGENSIYEINRELRTKFPNAKLTPIICDVQERDHLERVFSKYDFDIVYHAAAHKHVPMMEANPYEAFYNNVIGTKNVAELAKEYDVKNFVMVSTDKAVNPPNVMGATKRIAEMIVTNLNEEGKTKFNATRFGNVLGSRGSVVLLFKEQIAKGGPLTITDMNMTRYFMTIPEASGLVIQSGALARGGEIFILDMGEPVKIYDLAKKMIRLSGFQENEIDIIETGNRGGEKLYEELLVDKEKNPKQVFEKIFLGNVNGFNADVIDEFINTLKFDDEAEFARRLVNFANLSSQQ